jgi:hypothetical protein
VKCQVCDEPISRGKTCSPECRAEAARARARQWYSEHKGDPALRSRVAVATKRHYDRAKSDPNAWAQKLARTTAWRMANPDKVLEQERAYRVENADRVRAKNQRRRARLVEAFVEDVDLASIWDRDGGACGICGDDIDPSIAWPHKMSKTLDHILPLSKGGTHEPANAQLAHAVCNSRKNDRLLTS